MEEEGQEVNVVGSGVRSHQSMNSLAGTVANWTSNLPAQLAEFKMRNSHEI